MRFLRFDFEITKDVFLYILYICKIPLWFKLNL